MQLNNIWNRQLWAFALKIFSELKKTGPYLSCDLHEWGANLYRKLPFAPFCAKKYGTGWKVGWMGGKAVLRIAYSNLKKNIRNFVKLNSNFSLFSIWSTIFNKVLLCHLNTSIWFKGILNFHTLPNFAWKRKLKQNFRLKIWKNSIKGGVVKYKKEFWFTWKKSTLVNSKEVEL